MSIAPSKIINFSTKFIQYFFQTIFVRYYLLLILGAVHTCAGTVWKCSPQDLKSTTIPATAEEHTQMPTIKINLPPQNLYLS